MSHITFSLSVNHLYYIDLFRLNLSSTPSREKRTRDRDGAGPRTKKQKKQVAASSSSAAGFIQICDVDPDGRYIQIKNMSDKV